MVSYYHYIENGVSVFNQLLHTSGDYINYYICGDRKELNIVRNNLSYDYGLGYQKLIQYDGDEYTIIFATLIENDDMLNFAQDLIKQYSVLVETQVNELIVDYFNDAMMRMDKFALFVNDELTKITERSKLINFNPQSKSSRNFIDQ